MSSPLISNLKNINQLTLKASFLGLRKKGFLEYLGYQGLRYVPLPLSTGDLTFLVQSICKGLFLFLRRRKGRVRLIPYVALLHVKVFLGLSGSLAKALPWQNCSSSSPIIEL